MKSEYLGIGNIGKHSAITKMAAVVRASIRSLRPRTFYISPSVTQIARISTTKKQNDTVAAATATDTKNETTERVSLALQNSLTLHCSIRQQVRNRKLKSELEKKFDKA